LLKNRGQGIVSLKKSKTSHLKTLAKTEGKIVMLGNSITAECEWSELLLNPNILNRGVIGDGTEDILNRLDEVIALKPTKIFLLIGVNDLQFIPLSSISANYEKIVIRLRNESPTSKLFLESVLPIHNDLRRNGMKNEDINTLNKQIEQIAQKYSLTYLDLNSKFRNEANSLKTEFSLDGIHLNGEGYLIFKEAIQSYIND
jgi:lysophospholipase L1-like esterase